MRRTVVINWKISSFYGWGVYGLNLAIAWANDPDVELVGFHQVARHEVALDPIRVAALGRFFGTSNSLHAQIQAITDPAATVEAPLLAAMADDFTLDAGSGKIPVSGKPNIGVTFFETTRLQPDAVDRAARLPLIVTGSTWNERVLRAHGLTNVRTVLQGVDPMLFNLARPVARDDGRFRVFSGGKLELRKGQDIALAAFCKFAQRRPEAQLVAAWNSPWPELARTVDRTGHVAPVTFDAEGRLDLAAWAAANGLRPDQFINAGHTPNALMPQLLRQVDVALFPNRCEGGTNLVAMEAMACGVPVIISANSGHLDLIEDDNCFVLTQQRPVAGDPLVTAFGDVPGWGESEVDEAVELLERAYLDRDAARRRGERGAATLAGLSWARTAARMKEAVLGVSA